MIIQCPGCRKKYRYDVARFEGKTRKKIKCPGCAHVFEIQNPETKKSVDTTTAVRASEVMDAVRDKVVDEFLQRKRISLAFLNGPLSGQVYKITKSPVTIGRVGADIELDDPECSRKHAEIVITSDGVMLFDLDSTNGTFMDGLRIKETKLKNQDEFTIGASVFMLIVRDEDSEVQ